MAANVDDRVPLATVDQDVTARQTSTHQAAITENGSERIVTETVAMTVAGIETEAHQDAMADEMTIAAPHVRENCLTTVAAAQAVVEVEDAVSATVSEVPVVVAQAAEEIGTGESGSEAQHLLPKRRSLHPI